MSAGGTLAIARNTIGRRYRISAREMTAIIEAIAAAGENVVDGSTIVGRGADGRLCVRDRWIDDPGDEVRETAAAWARLCTDCTCVCVCVMRGRYYVGDDLREGVTIRHDQPGSMHPGQYAQIIFARAGMDDYSYLRRHCDRLLIVTPEDTDQVPEQTPEQMSHGVVRHGLTPAHWVLEMRKNARVDGTWCRIHDDGVLELRDPNDGQSSDPQGKTRYQYRVDPDTAEIERRHLPAESVGDAWMDTGVPEWEPSQTPPRDELMYLWWEAQVQ